MKKHERAKAFIITGAVMSLLCASLASYADKTIDSTGSSMKHLPGTPGGVPVLEDTPTAGQYPQICKDFSKAWDILKVVATGAIPTGASIFSVKFYETYAQKGTMTRATAYFDKRGNIKILEPFSEIAKTTAGKVGLALMVSAATAAATFGGLYGANCKYRLAVFNQSGTTVWCKVDIKSARDSLFSLAPGENVVIAGGIGFPIRQLYCDTNKEVVDKKGQNHQAQFKSTWNSGCKDEVQVTLTSGGAQSSGCLKP